MNENIEIIENKQLNEVNSLQISHINALRAENEILRDENETLFETNEILIKEIQKLKQKIKKTQGCGLCITCMHCQQDPYKMTPDMEAQEEAGQLGGI